MSSPLATSYLPPPALGQYRRDAIGGTDCGGYQLRGDDRHAGSRPLVSIVTVVRNGIATLGRAVESVLSQDYPAIEYIVVDGQSTDGSVELLRSLERRIALWTSEADDGISDAFNKGIALARGEVIGLLNCDDWYEAGAVRLAAEALERASVDIACGKVQYWDGDTRTYLVTSAPALLERTMTVAHPTVFVRRQCYAKWGLFRLDFRLAMDYEWLLRAKAAGARFETIDQCLANMQGGGIGDRRWRRSQREVARARAMHVAGANSALAYHSYVASSIVKGSVRRALDLVGLGSVRRWYHRWLSPVTVTMHRPPRR